MTEEKKEVQTQIFEALRVLAEQNFISYEEALDIFQDVAIKAFHNKFDADAELEFIIDESKGIFEMINNSVMVVDDADFDEEYKVIEMPLSEAKKIKKTAKVDDLVSYKVNFEEYSRTLAQQIRQMFTQAVRERKKEIVFNKHKELKGEMVEVTVATVTPTYAIFTLEDGTTAFMPQKLRNPNIPLKVNSKVKLYVDDVLKESKDAQIIVSNASNEMIIRVLEAEVPEIADGTVEVVAISRQPGVRAKVAVKSNKPEVDPVGAIIGAQGSRINAIIGKLEGEKLDVIPFSEDIQVFIANALSPAKIVSVVEKQNESGEVIPGNYVAVAPNNQQTLAIGKRGSNVRLAVELTKSRIDVASVEQAKEKEGYLSNFPFNVGITESDLQRIESGERFRKGGKQNENSFESSIKIDSDIFDDQILDFNSSLEETKTTTEDYSQFENEEMFSEEQLAQLQADFEFDTELDSLDEVEEVDYSEEF